MGGAPGRRSPYLGPKPAFAEPQTISEGVDKADLATPWLVVNLRNSETLSAGEDPVAIRIDPGYPEERARSGHRVSRIFGHVQQHLAHPEPQVERHVRAETMLEIDRKAQETTIEGAALWLRKTAHDRYANLEGDSLAISFERGTGGVPVAMSQLRRYQFKRFGMSYITASRREADAQAARHGLCFINGRHQQTFRIGGRLLGCPHCLDAA